MLMKWNKSEVLMDATLIVNPHVAEAIGIRKALSWIKNHKVMLETDCFEAVQAIRSAAEMFSYFGRIISECK